MGMAGTMGGAEGFGLAFKADAPWVGASVEGVDLVAPRQPGA